jgi:hypothetical protein
MDVGPNLGAINRAAIIAADYVAIPLAPDVFSVQALRYLGPTLGRWRTEWAERKGQNPDPELKLPRGTIKPIGYVNVLHSVRKGRPVKAYGGKWMNRIQLDYRRAVLEEKADSLPSVEEDPYCLGTLENYRSLMSMAMEARKPMFSLTPSDGAIGSHMAAVRDCCDDFSFLAASIAEAAGIPM